jgi:hypothetical protein
MMDIIRLSLDPDWRARLLAMFPRLTAAQLMRFDDLAQSRRIFTDDLDLHPAFLAWLQAVIGDEPPEAVLAGLPPAPRPVPGSKALEVQG